ncbi:hypothetical protein G3N59_25680 [Paraburkholderia sp. Ac-20340]|uniref:hypothetical protein n=1 Tax=Paraburkholderia sp. Ac-20340 TaxID=2703888 RepID=UPI00197FF21C|nr:hypothetical protein [Paraburkholderia sp. Ac-20340]MBN3856775.1 hypothetical protein [Paraburkholderia sp. Ac-20340]
MFNGSRVRQLADQVDARRAFTPSDALPLRRIGDEHAFEECLSLDRCRFEDMSSPLHRQVLNAVGERLGLPMVTTVVSTSSLAQTLRELASSVPDDRQSYRVSVQVEPLVPPGEAH